MKKEKFLLSAYKILLQEWGPQGWWPTTPQSASNPTYHTHKNRIHLSPQDQFEICLGAILTQNTSWTNVVKVLMGLKQKKLLSFNKLIKLPINRLEILFHSSGYFRQKARRIKEFLQIVKDRYQGDFPSLINGETSDRRKYLLSIKGIGPETADSMLLYAGRHKTFVVDSYTRRIGSRWGVLHGNESYDQIQKIFMRALPKSASIFREYHALLVKLGKELCVKQNPHCEKCPLRRSCVHSKKKMVKKGNL